ncbi:UvrD-helicase domain-containing protein [Jiangella endophytica]|uniref:UvrD-helicase domain-containing protein n=1 Tax=Jiangella endophytica TaxID=1623398 RepID=UPI000E353839|nr:UvrD-helicase domain-containing protein [Jiangella endophytica]
MNTESPGDAEDHPEGLSAEQIAALAPQVRLIEAGPGAGKTKTVIARLRARAAAGHRVALLSFTNAAVDVARARCRDVPGLVDAPNFVGTFDQFFHRYVLTPDVRRKTGQSPTYLSSWDDLPSHLAVVRPTNGGVGVRLSAFTSQHGEDSEDWGVDESQLTRAERRGWDPLTAWTRNQMNNNGSQRINHLLARHVYDTEQARRRALEVLADLEQPCLQRLALRFSEIIVDEFQDCDELEHQLLDHLRAVGIHVVVVADPDQAIYEFRNTSPQGYVDYRATLTSDQIAPLTTCFRSTQVICSLVSGLRSVGMDPINADPGHPGGAELVHVVVGSGPEAGTTAVAITRRYGVNGRQTRVLAHRRSDARALTRAGKEAPRGNSQMEVLMAPLADLLSGADARTRLAAAKRIERFVLAQFDWSEVRVETDGGSRRPASREEQLLALGVATEQLRLVVSRLLTASPGWTEKTPCSNDVHTILKDFAAGLGVELVSDLRRRLVVPPKVWEFWTSRTSLLTDAAAEAIRWGHIHGVKGEEVDAVVLAVPSKARPNEPHVLDDWASGTNSEQRRVLYVGVSRARRVLVLVVPAGRKQQLLDLLTGAGVPFDVSAVAQR